MGHLNLPNVNVSYIPPWKTPLDSQIVVKWVIGNHSAFVLTDKYICAL